MPPLPADSIHARACKLKCEKILTRPPSLVDGRIEIQQRCRRKIQQIKNMQRKYVETNLTEFRDILKEYVLELKAMTQPDAELSAVARNYIQNDPEEFIRNIAC